MTQRATGRRRLVAALAATLVVATTATALSLDARESAAQGGAPTPRYEGSPRSPGLLLGAATAGEPGEVWSHRPPRGEDPSAPFLLRYTTAQGWHNAEAAIDEHGQPYDGGTLRAGRVTPRGGLALIADDDRRPEGEQRVVMVRDAGGAPRVVPAPPAGVLVPGEGSIPPERLSETALGVRDRGTATEAFVSIVGRPLQTGIARWAADAWTREPICVGRSSGTPPVGCSAGETLVTEAPQFTVVGIAAAENGGAWALAREAPVGQRGLILLERVTSGSTARWRERDFDEPLFAAAATPQSGVASVVPLGVDATSDGVWLDGQFSFKGEPRSLMLYLGGTSTTTWCDATDAAGSRCDHPLGFSFAGPAPQSFAWPGPVHGSRVVGLVTAGGDAGRHYAVLEGERFGTRPTFADRSARMAFAAPDEGWIGQTHVTRDAWSSPLAPWSVPLRRPLTAIAGEPGRTPGDLDAQALAVGLGGSVLRYAPGQGWDSEALIAAGGVADPHLRGIAWPTRDFAYAVGDEGAMWRWRRATGLWERDPGAPFEFFGHLTAIAFQPGNPDRGYAVGRGGVMLRYDKSWTPEPLPPEVQTGGPLGGPVDITSIAFAGSQALAAAGRHLLVNDGDGWRVDREVELMIANLGERQQLLAVAGLPDGGAIVAGHSIVLERDGPTSPWRRSEPPGGTVVAVAAFREGAQVRALASLAAVSANYPRFQEVELPIVDPEAPTPRLPALTPPGDGYLVRETATGWRDEQRNALGSPSEDGALKADPILALLTDSAGRGWVVGGWNSLLDGQGRGIDAGLNPLLERMETSSVSRYDPAGAQASANVRESPVPTPAGAVRLAVGGGARCLGKCSDLAPIDIAPDRTLARAIEVANRLHAQADGPRALLYTGGRAAVPDAAEQSRFAQLMAGATVPLLPAIAAGEALAGSLAYEQAFGGFPAPLGHGPVPAGMQPVTGIGAPAAAGRARTHYAVDSSGPGGTVRVVAIDNSTGSLAARGMAGNPSEDQAAWLASVLADAKQRGIASVVVGNRALDPRAANAASDADQVAAILRDNGASAYVYEGDHQQHRGAIPAGRGDVPTFSSGTLGYRSGSAFSGYDVTGLLLLELDLARRDRASNRAPVSVRLVPVLDDLALEAVDGRVLDRSQPALFRGLGRRPRSGDLEDNYVALPSMPCTGASRCPDRIDPDVRFTSSDPDIANFVRIDRSSPNPRKPLLDLGTDKVIPDATSGLLCAFNAGTTRVTIESGGLAYSTTVTVRDGSVLRPCGTVPLDPSRFPRPDAPVVPAPAPAPAPGPNAAQPTPTVAPPPPPPPPPPAPVAPAPPPPAPPPFLPPLAAAVVPLPVLVPLTTPPAGRPLPPTGTSPVSSPTSVVQPAAKVQEEKEEEIAPEQQQSAVAYEPDGQRLIPSLLLGVVLCGALAAVGVRQTPRQRDRGRALAHASNRTDPRRHRRLP